MLSEIKESLVRAGYTSEEDINSRVISRIVKKLDRPEGDDEVVRFEWRNTMLNADTFSNHLKAYEEELYCHELRNWCREHGMLFKTDVGRVEASGYRGFDHVLIMPGAEYLRLISEAKPIPKEYIR